LARELKGFKTPDGAPVRPGTVRLADGRTAKGYYIEQFEDAWTRYLDGPIGEASQASQASQPTNPLPAALQPVTDVTDVTDTPGDNGQRRLDWPVVLHRVRAVRSGRPQADVPTICRITGFAGETVAAALAQLEGGPWLRRSLYLLTSSRSSYLGVATGLVTYRVSCARDRIRPWRRGDGESWGG
jgi:hypothetical protein